MEPPRQIYKDLRKVSWGGLVHHIGLMSGRVVETRSIERVPPIARWSLDDLQAVKVYTWGQRGHFCQTIH